MGTMVGSSIQFLHTNKQWDVSLFNFTVARYLTSKSGENNAKVAKGTDYIVFPSNEPGLYTMYQSPELLSQSQISSLRFFYRNNVENIDSLFNNWLVVFPVCLCRLPHYDGRLVLRVCVWGGGRQEVPLPWCPGSDATGAHCTSCLGPNGSPGVTTEILSPTSGLFDSALFLGCFYLSDISPHTSIRDSPFF